MTWQRARTPRQKAKREQEIMDAASKLFKEHPYSTITLRAIADEAGFTRSNVYRYFATKEEIFLQMYEDELDSCFTQIADALDALPEEAAVEAVVGGFMTGLLAHPRLLELTPLLTTSLEENTSEEHLVEYKLELLQKASHLYESMERHFPGLTLLEGYRLMMYIHSLVAGLWPAANPTPLLARVHQHPALAPLQFEFDPYMRQALEALFKHQRAQMKGGER